jgi:hypothetical protein
LDQHSRILVTESVGHLGEGLVRRANDDGNVKANE